jgi:hypothetical protein
VSASGVTFIEEIRAHRWLAIRAAVVGLVAFQLLRPCVGFLAYGVDRLVFLGAPSGIRLWFLEYRVWEIYRAILNCLAAVLTGWIIARIDLPHRMIGVVLFVPLLGLSLVIPLFASNRGFYIRDIVMMAAIAGSPLIRGIWLGRRPASSH